MCGAVFFVHLRASRRGIFGDHEQVGEDLHPARVVALHDLVETDHPRGDGPVKTELAARGGKHHPFHIFEAHPPEPVGAPVVGEVQAGSVDPEPGFGGIGRLVRGGGRDERGLRDVGEVARLRLDTQEVCARTGEHDLLERLDRKAAGRNLERKFPFGRHAAQFRDRPVGRIHAVVNPDLVRQADPFRGFAVVEVAHAQEAGLDRRGRKRVDAGPFFVEVEFFEAGDDLVGFAVERARDLRIPEPVGVGREDRELRDLVRGPKIDPLRDLAVSLVVRELLVREDEPVGERRVRLLPLARYGPRLRAARDVRAMDGVKGQDVHELWVRDQRVFGRDLLRLAGRVVRDDRAAQRLVRLGGLGNVDLDVNRRGGCPGGLEYSGQPVHVDVCRSGIFGKPREVEHPDRLVELAVLFGLLPRLDDPLAIRIELDALPPVPVGGKFFRETLAVRIPNLQPDLADIRVIGNVNPHRELLEFRQLVGQMEVAFCAWDLRLAAEPHRSGAELGLDSGRAHRDGGLVELPPAGAEAPSRAHGVDQPLAGRGFVGCASHRCSEGQPCCGDDGGARSDPGGRVEAPAGGRRFSGCMEFGVSGDVHGVWSATRLPIFPVF